MQNAHKNIINDAILKNIHNAVHDLKTGIVVIRVKEFKITRIETTREQNFEEVWIEEGSGI